MYTVIDRRKFTPERIQETRQRAQSEFFPKLQAAPGFTSFYLVADEEQGVNTAIIVWESKAHADAFQQETDRWGRTLEELENMRQSTNRGETVIALEPQK